MQWRARSPRAASARSPRAVRSRSAGRQGRCGGGVCAASGAARVECSPGSQRLRLRSQPSSPGRNRTRLLSSMLDRPARKRRRAGPFITIEGFEGFCVRLTGGECGAPSANRLGCAPRNNRRARPHTASCRRR